MTTTGYLAAADVLADRIRWTLATLGQLIDRGRAESWLEGARVATPDPEAIAAEIATRLACSTHAPTVLPMEWMAVRLGLERRELDALWLLACIEIAPGAARLAQTLGTPDCPELSLLILRQLSGLADRALDALDRLGLIELSTDARLPQQRRGVRANDRVVALARGELELDVELAAIATLHAVVSADTEVVPSFVEGIAALPAPVLIAVGPEGAGRATRLAATAALVGRGTLRIRAPELAHEPVRLRRQLRALLREACLFDVVPLFEDLDSTPELPVSAVLDGELRHFTGPILASAQAPVRFSTRPVIAQRLVRPEGLGRRQQWGALLPEAAADVIDRAATRYALWPGAIAAAARNARALAGDDQPVTAAAIHAGVRAHLGEQLDGLATRIDWRQTWDDLVLPPDQFEQLIELVARVRHRGHVLEAWGFGDKIGKGHGVAALLSGPPGTGKTMVAGLIAHELGLDLYQVDLSKVVSKYIGETEKQLAALFDAAESGQAIILFDEADALFAKRSAVKSSNDRYANLEVNFLLQRIEAFTGIALLTTNHETAIDEAFRRRLALHVRFPMPDEAQRAALWRAMIPAKAEVAPELEVDQLAREFVMSGGYIKNAVVRAAYLAADQGAPIEPAHLRRAARAEYEGIGKISYQHAA